MVNQGCVKEVLSGLLEDDMVTDLCQKNSEMSYIYHPHNPLLLGRKALLKVNTNIGVSSPDGIETELAKLRLLSKLKYAPDSMMDHTYVHLDKPFWKYMVEEFDHPVGTLPHYLVFDSNTGLDLSKLLEQVDEMGQGGVNFMTLHLTAGARLLEIAKSCRSVPTTARGGALTVKDAIINNRDENIFADNFNDFLKLFKKYQMTLSIGTTFRPACINEALDEVQIAEIKVQKEYIDYAKSYGIQVIMEGVGHISLDLIPQYCDLIADHGVPLMPLGPMLTDSTIGFDHVTSAIGATTIALFGNVGSINSVTREEHTGGVPDIDSIVEGLKAARVSAHCINLSRFAAYKEFDRLVSDNRATGKTCVISGGIFGEDFSPADEPGCSRCRYECPLKML
jgi:phosphomethylpyrimidine synthase